MRYEIPILWHTASAKTKAIIPCAVNVNHVAIDWVIVDANSDDQAYTKVVKRLASKRDLRPIMGRTYVRKWRAPEVTLNRGLAPTDRLPKFNKGDRVILHKAHVGHRLGTVDEVFGDWHYSIALDDYPNLVDFTIREFALREI